MGVTARRTPRCRLRCRRPFPTPTGPPHVAPSSASSATSSPATPAPGSAPLHRNRLLRLQHAITAVRAAEAVREHWRIRPLPTTAVTLPSAKTARASAPIPASSPGCAVSASISSKPIAKLTRPGPLPRRLAGLDISSTSSAFHSVEQPCGGCPGCSAAPNTFVRCAFGLARP